MSEFDLELDDLDLETSSFEDDFSEIDPEDEDLSLESILNDMGCLDEIAIESMTLTEDEENEVFLDALESTFGSPEEFASYVRENAEIMGLYGLVSDSDVAMETMKNIVKLNKLAVFNRQQKRTAITLAARAKDRLYVKYVKFRKLMIDARLAIYKKYGARAKGEARRALSNSRRKASTMHSPVGKDLVSRMDKQIEKMDKQKDKVATK